MTFLAESVWALQRLLHLMVLSFGVWVVAGGGNTAQKCLTLVRSQNPRTIHVT